MSSWLVNEGPKWMILMIYLIINASLFGYAFNTFNSADEFMYLRLILHKALPFARATGFVLNFNCLLILLPVCRNLMSFMRGSCTCCRRSIRRQFDKNLFFHKWVAYTICLLTAVHCIAHCYNGQLYVSAYSPHSSDVVKSLCNLDRTNGTWINPFENLIGNEFDSLHQILQTWAGLTGVVITLVLILMVTSATEIIRRSYFEVFWFTHHLFVLFFIGLLLHGIQGIVRSQSNLDAHDIHNTSCSQQPDNWGKDATCAIPQFQKTPAASWKWLTAPIIIYLFERCLRFYRSRKKIWIQRVISHPSNVMEIQMICEGGFSADVGQYVFIQCSSISPLEWHPFTLTSAPEDDFMSVHIRQAGDWTRQLAKLYLNHQSEDPRTLPCLSVDGPFGTASEDVFKYQAAMLVASGIGVTPFASVLKSIWYKYERDDSNLKLRKVYFYWLCNNTNSFEWFSELLKQLEDQMAARGQSHFISINIHLTSGWKPDLIDDAVQSRSEERCVITGLRSKTKFGRPDWDVEFSNIMQENIGVRSVGVFYCGVKQLSHQLHKMSNKHSSNDITGTQFHYNKENF